MARASEPAACPICAAEATRLLRVPTLVRSGFSAPDPGVRAAAASSAATTSETDDQPLDPTKPNKAWRHLGAGCPCCPGGVHITRA